MSAELDQKKLTQWLKTQGLSQNKWLRFTLILATLNTLVFIAFAAILAYSLDALIVLQRPINTILPILLWLLPLTLLRAILTWSKEKTAFAYGRQMRQRIRQQVLDKIEALGPAWLQNKPIGHWTTIIVEQIEELQDFYARYLPQMKLVGIVPCIIFMAVLPINWASAIILLLTCPLIPIFMVLVGKKAADASQENFSALGRLSGHFLDRLKGIETLRLFHYGETELQHIQQASENFRERTMSVLKLAFLSSGVLELFSSLSIAMVAVYFGFSYLGEFHFGGYGTTVTLFAGFMILILTPEFFQPLRDLGTFYHAKAQALGAAESLYQLLVEDNLPAQATYDPPPTQTLSNPLYIEAQELIITTVQGKILAGPLNFTIEPGQHILLVGRSGAGKSSLLNVLLGFLPYQGSLKINGVELYQINLCQWRHIINWIGQQPKLPEATLLDNVLLGNPQASDEQLQQALQLAHVDEFLPQLPHGLQTKIGEDASFLSVGQAQRIAVARALLKPSQLLLLDEPTASLDSNSQQLVQMALHTLRQGQATLHVTHQLKQHDPIDVLWVMEQGKFIYQGDYSEYMQQHYSS